MRYEKTGKQTKVVSNVLFFEEVNIALTQGKSVKIPVKGNSMLPFLRSGDVVLLKSADTGTLRKGDVLLGHYQDDYVLHRLVKKRKDHFVLAGDGNERQVEKLKAQDVLAVATLRIRDEEEKQLDTCLQRCKGICWYRLRLLRRWGRRFKNMIK